MDQSIYQKLVQKLGAHKVSVNRQNLDDYRDDMTELPAHSPDYLVTAYSKADILSVVELGREHNCPIIPVVAKTNTGGLTIPSRGGIILDLKALNRILEVNETDQYMRIEPGVTFGQVKEHLDAFYPSLRFGYPLSPPYTSVLANCLLDGLGNLSLKHGPMGDWINGLEAVLSTGDIIKTGSGAYSGNWSATTPLPDLTALFTNFQSTTGIVTELSVELYPKLKHRKRLFILTYSVAEAYGLIRTLTRVGLCDDIAGLSWPLSKMLFDVKYPRHRDPEEPLIIIYLDLSSDYEKELSLKLELIDDIISEARQNGSHIEEPFDIETLIQINPAFQKFSELPTTLDFLLEHGGGGLTWIGTYGPWSQWEKGIAEGMKIMEEAGFPPIMVSRPMRNGHFVVLRFITLFDKGNPAEVQKVSELNQRLCRMTLNLGFIPYKTPGWIIDELKPDLDPGYQKYLKLIQKLMDPSGIMNPGRWNL
ncbi:MAG: FAD-binding oxidoreductase [Spirochaetota bacterium]|nr:FAD-binding oxidoreductase [Spirochaetota bacterium]